MGRTAEEKRSGAKERSQTKDDYFIAKNVLKCHVCLVIVLLL